MIQRIMILSFPRPTDRARRAIAAGLLATCATLPMPLFAQDMVSQPVVQSSANPVDPEELARAASQRQLTEALGFIAADGSNWFALSQAGRAALALGDARAAIGFLARAEALAPRDPVIKAALGAAMVQLEDPQQAMRYFEAAIAAGGLDRAYLGDRGLAFDLLGDQRRAQADYAVAAQSNPSAELTRRHAISLGISGQPDEAIRMLAPLLRAQDRAAWRSRAMIVAMNGRPDEARQIARTTMPGQLAEALDPYFALMDRLTPDQLAAASHFGRFPTYDTLRGQPSRANAVRVAAATTTAAPEPASARGRDRTSRNRDRSSNRNSRRAPTASPAPRPAPAAVRVAVVPRTTEPNVPAASSAPPPPAVMPPAAPVVRAPAQQVAAAPAPTTSLPPAAQTTPPTITPVVTATVRQTVPALSSSPAASIAGPPDTEPGFSTPVTSVAAAPVQPAQQLAAAPAPVATPTAAPPPVPTTQLAGWSLDSVVGSMEIPDTELAASANALSLADLDAIAAEQRRAAQAAAEARATARATERAEARTRAATEAEARRREEARVAAEAEATRRRSPARFWVQVATGSSTSALAFDCRRLAREYAASFRGQSCATAAWNRTNRLVVGPFRTMAAAREWETAYKRAGGDGFAWASDAGEEVTPVGRGR